MFYVSKRNNNYLEDLDKLFNCAFTSTNMKSDLEENESEYLLNVDMPGVNKEDINISFDDSVLTVKFEKKNEEKKEEKNYVFKERCTSSESRSFYLENANAEDIKAKLENGVLSIKVGKTLPVETKKTISIE